MTTFTWTDEYKLRAWQHIGTVLAGGGILDETPEQAHRHPDCLAWYGKYTAQGHAPIVEHSTFEKFAKDFALWFSAVYETAEPVGNTMRVGMTITRHYGPISVSFELSQDFAQLPGHAGQHAAVRYLDAAIKAMATEWERANLGAVAQQGREHAGQQQNGAQSVASETITGELEHAYEGGKHRWRFRGGRWSKFGVPVYTEALKAAGLDDSEPMGTVGEYRATIEFGGDGKPKRAVNLEPLAEEVEF